MKGRFNDPDHMVDDATSSSMILCRKLKEKFSLYVCNMCQKNTHPFKDYIVEKDPAKILPKHRILVEFQRDLNMELEKASARSLHSYDQVHDSLQKVERFRTWIRKKSPPDSITGWKRFVRSWRKRLRISSK